MVGFPKVMELSVNSQNISQLCSSQVLTVKLGKPSTTGIAFPDYKTREVYKNDGQELSCATTAVLYKDRLLIGSLYGDMLYCDVKFY